jgi:hypothetical protein
MSIIYDALKKVEEANTTGALPGAVKQEKQPRPKVKGYFIYALVICAGLFMANLVFNFLSGSAAKSAVIHKNPIVKAGTEFVQKVLPPSPPKVQPAAVPQKTTEAKKEQKGSWVLSGVFFSENEGYALINNQIAKEGDVIDGATVKRINLDGVELESAGSTVTLSNRFVK